MEKQNDKLFIMTSFITLWKKLLPALFGALVINLTIMFTVPPATTAEIIIKDALSLIVGLAIYMKLNGRHS